jgi:hypothetical protein
MCTMWPAGHQGEQPVGRRLAAFRRRRGFDRVDVEVQRARMVRRLAQHRLQRGYDIGAMAFRRLGVGLPVVPRLGVHHRLGVEGRRVEVGGVLAPELAHRCSIGLVQRMAVGLGILRIAAREGRDPGLLAR